MSFNVATYNPQQTPVHALDARVKILLVLAYSLALFFVHSWWALGLLGLLLAVCALLARLDLLRAARSLAPVAFILVVTLLANSFVLDVNAYNPHAFNSAVSAGIFADVPPCALVGSFGFVPAGFARGCYYVLRIVLLLAASLVLTTTTSSTEIMQALQSFLRPLARFGLPVRDLATVVSIALRFIPVTIDEFQQLRTAQIARGAAFETGSVFARLKAWATVLVPLFVGLYRRADNLALAMDARCYGGAQATQLNEMRFGLRSASVLACGLAICVILAVWG